MYLEKNIWMDITINWLLFIKFHFMIYRKIPLPTSQFSPSSQEKCHFYFLSGKNLNACNIQVGDGALEQIVVCQEFVSILLSLTLQPLFGSSKAQVMLSDSPKHHGMLTLCHSGIMWTFMGSEGCTLKFYFLIWGHLSSYCRRGSQVSSPVILSIGLDELEVPFYAEITNYYINQLSSIKAWI